MEIDSASLDKIVCGLCEGYLSYGPVKLLTNGRSACGRCSPPDRKVVTRNLPYEHLAEAFLFPCAWTRDCLVMSRFSDAKKHEDNCEYRLYDCVLLNANGCDWLGSLNELLDHCMEDHSDKVLANSSTIKHDVTVRRKSTFIMTAFNELFMLHGKICMKSQKIYYCVQFIGGEDHASRYRYKIQIKNPSGEFTKICNVVHYGGLALEERIYSCFGIEGVGPAVEGIEKELFIKITIIN